MASTRTRASRGQQLHPRGVTELHTATRERLRTRQRLTLPVVLSIALVLVAALASGIGVFNPGTFRDPAMTAGNARGTALVVLVVAVPLIAGSLILSARGSARAGVIWLGSLGYVLYNSVLFGFAMTFNRLFLVYVAMFALALWSVVTALMRVDAESLRERFKTSTPVRGIALYLIVVSALTYIAWLRDIVPALVHNTLPSSLDRTVMLANPIEVMDLSISLPLLALAGVWLWRRRAWGYVLAGALLR